MSGVKDLIAVYRELEARCAYPLHLGLTEAGMGLKGTVSTTAALSVLLLENIGDTIRVSLTPEPGQSRTAEVELACEILQALGMRNFTPQVVPARLRTHDQLPLPGAGKGNLRILLS